ncbi:ribosome recycling factor [Chloroflexota bacterium]
MHDQILIDIEDKMNKTKDGLKKELATIRTGHANPNLVENIKVDYADTIMPLNQIAGISAPEARLLVIQPWDKSIIGNIEKAILTSDLGLNPTNDGNVIRINIPLLSEERRKELIKVVRKRVEDRKIAIRNLRREAMDGLKELEKNKDISQDEQKRASEQLQKITDSFITNAEQIGQKKEEELMQV